MNEDFLKDKPYSSSVPLTNYFSALGLSNKEPMIPNIAQGLPSSSYISKINQVQMMNDKVKALEQKNQSDSEYLNRYLQSNNEKLKQLPRFTPISQNPTQYSSAMESLPYLDNRFAKPMAMAPQRILNPLAQYQLQGYDPNILNDNNTKGNRLSQSQKISPQLISRLQGDLFKTRDNINRMKNNLKNIKSSMFSKMEEMEEKQDVTLEKLRNVIMIAKTNGEKGASFQLKNNNNKNISNNSNKKANVKANAGFNNQRNSLKRNSNNNISYTNNNSNQSNNVRKNSLNFNESGFFREIARIIDRKLIEHDQRMQRGLNFNSRRQSVSNSLPPIKQ